MEALFRRVENVIRLAAWRGARALGRARIVSPIQWRDARPVEIPPALLSDASSTEERERLEHIRMEIQLYSRLSSFFPERPMKDSDWRILVKCESLKQRIDHIKFIHLNELKRTKDIERKFRKRKEAVHDDNGEGPSTGVEANEEDSEPRESVVEPETPTAETDDLRGTSPFLPTEFASRERRLRMAAALREYSLPQCPQLVIDCRYLGSLSPRGANLTASQIAYLVTENRERRVPWRLTLARFDEADETVRRLRERKLSHLSSTRDATPVISAASLSELFPVQDVVYLSPHAEEEMTGVESDKVYVIGGIVDRVTEKGIPPDASRVAADAEGVRCVRFPLDTHVKWKSGTRFLTLVAVMKILQDLHASNNDWEYALGRNIPIRNTRAAEDKNPIPREHHAKIREYDRRIREIVEKEMRKIAR